MPDGPVAVRKLERAATISFELAPKHALLASAQRVLAKTEWVATSSATVHAIMVCPYCRQLPSIRPRSGYLHVDQLIIAEADSVDTGSALGFLAWHQMRKAVNASQGVVFLSEGVPD